MTRGSDTMRADAGAAALRPRDERPAEMGAAQSIDARERAPSPDREMEILMERFARDDGTLTRAVRFKLAVPDAVREKYERDWHLYWFNDEGGRIQDMTTNDFYVPVDEVEPVVVGRNTEGKPTYARLFKKPRAIYDRQRAAKDNRILEQERGLMAAPRSDPLDNRSDEHSYVPKGNRIS